MVNMNILAQKIWLLQMGPKNKITIFKKMTVTILIKSLSVGVVESVSKVSSVTDLTRLRLWALYL
jgi:hypothetical protein